MASAANQSSVLEGELTCPVCLDVFDNPHLLPCGHNLCLTCMHRIKRQAGRARFRCPECRESHRSSVEPLKNFKLANIANNYRKRAREAANGPAPDSRRQAKNAAAIPCDYCPPWRSQAAGEGAEAGAPGPWPESVAVVATAGRALAVKTCLKCEVSMCEEHVKPHLELLAFREHPLTEPLTDLRKRTCSEHDEMYRYYCMEDKMCLCNACTIEGNHSGHTIKTLKNTMKDLKRSVETQLHRVERRLRKAEGILQKLKEEERKIQEDSEQCLTVLGEELRRRLEDFLASLRECTCSHSSILGLRLQENLTRACQDQARLQELRSSIEDLLQENDPFLFLEVHSSSTKRHCSELKKHLFTPNLLSMDTDTLGDNMEAKMEEFLSVVRTHTKDAIDSLCPGSGSEEDEEDYAIEVEEDDSESVEEEEEMQSEREEEEEEEEEDEHNQTESADEDFSPESEEEEEESEEDEEEEEEEGHSISF